MPIKIPLGLPASEILQNENIFVMDEDTAYHQDIRPLRIAIFNIMPTKITTETQLLRLLANTPLQVEITLLHPASYQSKHTPAKHLAAFYDNLENIKEQKFDGMIITGAPVENLEYCQVAYWDELTDLFEWTKKNVTSTLHICWGAQAALYYHYGIEKKALPEKMFGVFEHVVDKPNTKLLRGFDDVFLAPHSRHTEILEEDIKKEKSLEILSHSEEAGLFILASVDGRQIFVTGHFEYDPLTLKAEYERDIGKGLKIAMPRNYFQDNDPSKPPIVRWRGHANLFYFNWLNYYVYQETPYDLSQIKGKG